MSSQEISLTPKEKYAKRPKKWKVLVHPTITEKTEQLTLLQRHQPTVGKDTISTLPK